jgi:hypothetical protein
VKRKNENLGGESKIRRGLLEALHAAGGERLGKS